MMATASFLKEPSYLRPNLSVEHKLDLFYERRDHMEKISALFTNMAEIRYLWGYPGSGKTTHIKVFMDKIHKWNPSSIVIYVPCSVYNSPTKLLNFLYLSLVQHFPEMKETKESEGIRAALAKVLEKETPMPIFLIFDEIDQVIIKSTDPTKDKLMHFLVRLTSNTPTLKEVFITNVVNIEEHLETEVLCMIRASAVNFGSYGCDEILDILQKRVNLALEPGSITLDLLQTIAKKTFKKYDSNIRDALWILRQACVIASERGNSNVDSDAVEDAFLSLRVALISQRVKSFPEGALQYLAALKKYKTSLLESNKSKQLNTTNLTVLKKDWDTYYSYYCEEYKIEKKDVRSLLNYINEFEAVSLVRYTGKKINKSKVYSFTIPFNSLDGVLSYFV